ncbi:probable sodium/metabolite cotransporter BASS4, chloroplastic isoform X1 [Phoenix dactylifera]|uniref:Probable sodium/metabolite cotransporter BASS4, chloroplastic n=1 Tax=Phoenix dactylifera TaxID=42345 RepID=A0A8B7BRW8_PHODC|nr:probable sodium/metabolite cotransporter BASS4, chloroplastic isoform X1 [Phoenix dactylifera]XP_026658781.1 probable sodium/metabolite cotransporter BASS4, chloroplastic isoform X1 [Phoenix dactylifera]
MAVGSLQTLAFRPPSAARNSVSGRRIASFPANLFSFSREFLIAIAPPSLFAKSRPVARCPRAIGGSGKVYGDGNYQSKDSNTRKVFSWTQPLLDFVGTNFLPLALVSGITLGLINPTLGCLAHKYSLSRFSACGIFFISGLMLHSGELGAAIEAWPAGLFGLGSILLFTPFFSRLILQIQLMPHEFVTGLAIFCCMPTTLSSGVTLTRLAGGNAALALAMTVISNLLGIMIVPFSISRYIGAGAGVSVPTLQLFKSLITNLVVPLILGKVIRDSSERMAEYVDRNLRSFAMISAVLLSLVPWMQVSRSRSLLLTVKPAMFAIAIGMGTLLHLILLAFNTLTVSSLSLVSGGSKSVFAKKDNARAVIVVASQKTLPVLVAVVEQLGRAFGEPGLLVLPCVASHINQILIDSFMVNLWLWKDRLSANTKEA